VEGAKNDPDQRFMSRRTEKGYIRERKKKQSRGERGEVSLFGGGNVGKANCASIVKCKGIRMWGRGGKCRKRGLRLRGNTEKPSAFRGGNVTPKRED